MVCLTAAWGLRTVTAAIGGKGAVIRAGAWETRRWRPRRRWGARWGRVHKTRAAVVAIPKGARVVLRSRTTICIRTNTSAVTSAVPRQYDGRRHAGHAAQ